MGIGLNRSMEPNDRFAATIRNVLRQEVEKEMKKYHGGTFSELLKDYAKDRQERDPEFKEEKATSEEKPVDRSATPDRS